MYISSESKKRVSEYHMNRTERLAEIKKVVEESGRIEVNDLSDMFHVSEVTIRKDLSLLEDRQCIRRIHGAALPKGEISDAEPIREDSLGMHIEYDRKKEEIGKISGIVGDGHRLGVHRTRHYLLLYCQRTGKDGRGQCIDE